MTTIEAMQADLKAGEKLVVAHVGNEHTLDADLRGKIIAMDYAGMYGKTVAEQISEMQASLVETATVRCVILSADGKSWRE